MPSRPEASDWDTWGNANRLKTTAWREGKGWLGRERLDSLLLSSEGKLYISADIHLSLRFSRSLCWLPRSDTRGWWAGVFREPCEWLRSWEHAHTNAHANCCQCWIWPRVLWERSKRGKHTFRVWWTCHPGRRRNNLLFHLVHSAGCLLLRGGCCHPAGNESVYWARPSICTAPGCAITASGAVNVTSVGTERGAGISSASARTHRLQLHDMLRIRAVA